jgi:diguanylate cyclase (GGDEF)-like protein
MFSVSQFEAFLLNIVLYSVVPLYLATIKTRTRTISFYIYNSVVLVIGGLVGSIYSFSFSDNLVISGGNIAFSAFMMNTVMLIIIERNIDTFRNMIRFVVLIDAFIFCAFNFLSWLLKSDLVINPLQVPPEIFHVSLWILILGGTLILFELLILLFIFTQVRKLTSNITFISVIYTFAFILVLCLDGVLFPVIAFGASPELSDIIVGNVSGKLVLALCYSVPMLLFYVLFRKNLIKFVDTPMPMKELVVAPRRVLLEKLYHYEERDKQLQRDKDELLVLSSQDGLTKLYNKRQYDQTFESEWLRCKRNSLPLTLVIGDVDFFKAYNDLYGHKKGDECLKDVALLWQGVFKRPSDLAARIGGEEFGYILPETSTENCIQNLNYFMKLLARRSISHTDSSVAAHVTMSCGVATMVPNDNNSSDELFELADQRLYKAKQSGRNCIISE